MKLIVPQSTLREALRTAAGILTSAHTLPILGHVRLQATRDGQLAVHSTNLEQYQTVAVAVAVDLPGDLCLRADLLLRVVTSLPEGDLQLETQARHQLTLTSGPSRYTFLTLPPEEFPQFPTLPEQPAPAQLALPAHHLHRLLRGVSFAVADPDMGRPNLENIALQPRPGGQTLRAAATDGRRLALAEIAHPFPETAAPILLPKPLFRQLLRAIDPADEDVQLTLRHTPQLLRLQFGATTLWARLPDQQFPNIDPVIPLTNTANGFPAASSELRRAAQAIGRLHQALTLQTQREARTLAVSFAADDDTATETLLLPQPPLPFTRKLTAEYLTQPLEVAPGEQIHLHPGDHDAAPLTLRCQIPSTLDWTCVIMPLRNN